MATLLVNLSGGILSLDSIRLQVPPGGRMEFDMTADELKAKCPELSGYLQRNRVMLSEDAQIVEPSAEEKAAAAKSAAEKKAEREAFKKAEAAAKAEADAAAKAAKAEAAKPAPAPVPAPADPKAE